MFAHSDGVGVCIVKVIILFNFFVLNYFLHHDLLFNSLRVTLMLFYFIVLLLILCHWRNIYIILVVNSFHLESLWLQFGLFLSFSLSQNQ